MNENKQKGNIGELRAALDLARAGASIFKEIGESSRCDLIADIKGRLVKIQVKSVSIKDGVYIFASRKTTTKYRYNYTSKDVDIFAIYCVDDDVVAWVVAKDWIDDSSPSCVCIRLRASGSPARNGQTKNVRKLDDFTSIDRSLKDFLGS